MFAYLFLVGAIVKGFQEDELFSINNIDSLKQSQYLAKAENFLLRYKSLKNRLSAGLNMFLTIKVVECTLMVYYSIMWSGGGFIIKLENQTQSIFLQLGQKLPKNVSKKIN